MSADLKKILDEVFRSNARAEVKNPSLTQVREAFERFESLVAAKMVAQNTAANVALNTVTSKITELENKLNKQEKDLADFQAKFDAYERTQRFLTGQATPQGGAVGGTTPTNNAPATPLARPSVVVNMVQQLDKLTTEKSLPDYGVGSDKSFAEWAERFKDICAASDITTEERKIALLKIKLIGWARQRFDELEANEKDTLAHAITTLTPKFDTDDDQHAALAKLRSFPPMQEGQGVMTYAEKLENLIIRALKGKAADVINQRLLEEFLDRMPYNLAFYVREKSPADFEAALKHARKFEAIWAIPPRTVINSVPKTVNIAEVAELKDEIEKLRSEMQQNGMQHQKTSRAENMGTHRGSKSIKSPLVLMLIVAIIFQTTDALSPMICQKNALPTIIHFPEKPECPKQYQLMSTNSKTAWVTVYQQNVAVHEAISQLCRIVFETFYYWTSVENEDINRIVSEEKPVGIEECEGIINKHKCALGQLKNLQGCASTVRSSKIEYTWHICGSLSEEPVPKHDCMLSPTNFWIRGAKKTMHSHVGDLSAYEFDNGPQLISGLAERFVGMTKLAVKKILVESPNLLFGLAVQHILDDYQTNRHKTTGQTPAQILFQVPRRTIRQSS
uniref:Retrotransposon gag domain-containing protein n=1 Tax=Panagrolaimus davidi TaxID=227884 RepID=A0A914Q0Q7_9BILA